MIHHQDIRRPLGVPREVPADRLRCALDFATWAPPIKARPRIHGLTLTATDIDWAAGQGPLVEGTGEALLPELTGPGAAVLAVRVTG